MLHPTLLGNVEPTCWIRLNAKVLDLFNRFNNFCTYRKSFKPPGSPMNFKFSEERGGFTIRD